MALVWPDESRPKRELPTKLRVALVAGIGLLVLIVVFGNRGTRTPPVAMAEINDEMVVSADDLKNRREVSADDFRPRRQFLRVAATPTQTTGTAPTPQAAEEASPDLAARRARREADPEDVLTLKNKRNLGSAGGSTGSNIQARSEAPFFSGPVYVSAKGSPAPGASGAGEGAAARASRHLVGAGTAVSAILVTPVELRGNSATVLVKVVQGVALPPGSRFLGTATASDGRVTMHFRTLLLPDGRQVRVDAEAQDDEGAFGIASQTRAAKSEDDDGSSLGDIAKDTATDVVVGALGSDIAGRAADRYLRGSRGRHGVTERPAATVAAGTKLQVFVNETLDLER
jgi:hypothetical protein